MLTLDGLRAVAFGLVLVSHLGVGFLGGGYGVDIFFALSGFLITTILVREIESRGKIDLGRFYIRRSARLLPALVLVVVACCLYAAMFRSSVAYGRDTIRSAPAVLFYVGNWLRAGGGSLGFLGHTWSLSVEEQFYLVWPLIVMAVYRRAGRAGVLGAALALSGASLAARCVLVANHASIARIYNGADTNMDRLLIGSALAIVYLSRPVLTAKVARIGAVPAVALLAVVIKYNSSSSLMLTAGLTMVALSSAVLIAFLVTSNSLAVASLAWAPVVYVGQISYGLYLWHYPIISIIGGEFPSAWASAIGVVPATLIMATASYYVLERPIMRAVHDWQAARPRRLGAHSRARHMVRSMEQIGSLEQA